MAFDDIHADQQFMKADEYELAYVAPEDGEDRMLYGFGQICPIELNAGVDLCKSFKAKKKCCQSVVSETMAGNYTEVATLLGERRVWKLMLAQLGFDEQTPGSKVNADTKRKNVVCVMNFLELANAWIVPLVLRTGFSRIVRGGWSAKNSERSQRRRSRSSPRIHLLTASRRFDLLQMTQYRE